MNNQLIDKILDNRPIMTTLAVAGGLGAYLGIILGGYGLFLAIVFIGN